MLASSIILIIISLLTLFLLIELAIFLLVNDFTVQGFRLPTDMKKILIIYPHPDDEILTTGGLIKKNSHFHDFTWALLSKGERGTPDAKLSPDLKEIRPREAENVGKLLNIKQLLQFEFTDFGMKEERTELHQCINSIIETHKPDLLITYDESGLYGHPDHIVTSEVVTQIAKDRGIRLWYSTYPKRVLDLIHLPKHMAEDPLFENRRKVPNRRVYVGLEGSSAKSRGVTLYRSQLHSFRSGFPIKFIPMSWYILPTIYEYFYEVGEEAKG